MAKCFSSTIFSQSAADIKDTAARSATLNESAWADLNGAGCAKMVPMPTATQGSCLH